VASAPLTPGDGVESGWLGVRVDGRPDWAEVREVIEDAYRTIAPARLVAQLDG
jgi:hypothetical protein